MASKTELVTPPALTPKVGDWNYLKTVLADTNDVNLKIKCFHEYLGNKMLSDGTHEINFKRGGSVKPTILSAQFVHDLSVSNLEQRRIQYPSFVRLAELLDEIRQLESIK
jgi:hypothetical protein